MTLELKNVSKTVGGETHIAGVSLTLEPGSINVLLGPTLSGKTSLMRLMAGLDAPTAGQVLVNGKDVTGLPVGRRSVAMVYQQFINYPNLSVYENIASPLRVAGMDRTTIEEKVREAAHLMKLERELSRTPLELSGGQQQRTAIARALVKGAGLVLLDEPLANLDYKLREEMREELPRIFGESGAIFVYATTEPSEALLIGGSTATLSQGRITQFGKTVSVYRAPDNLVTAQTFSDPPLNTLPVTKKGARINLSTGESFAASGTMSGLGDGEYVLGIRPNHLQLEKSGTNSVRLDGTIAVTEITGSESFVHADAAGRRWVAIVHAVLDLQIGEAVSLYLDPTRFFVFDTSGALVSAPDLQYAA